MSEELDKTPAILNIDSEIASRHHPIQHANVFPPSIQPTHRVCTSLPLYLTKSDLCTLVPRPGMEYVPLRTPAAEPYHYHHVTDQTKSLQELQNEVGALLEFRDLVIETFPDLKTKMASSAANSTLTGIPSSSSSLAIRREWEPGIRIRRKLIPKDTGSGSIGGGGSSSSTTIIPGGGGSNSGSISGSSNHSNHAGGHGASSGGAPVGAGSVAGSSNSSNSSSTTTTTALNQQQPQQQQHTHQHHHHHHHHTHTQHGSNSSGNHHPHQQQQQQQQQHSSSSLIRSRSNSHSGKKEPKSGEGNNGSVIQDSGFSTETSSSKETHSAASSTSGAVQGALILSTTINRLAVETEDELWNLLDVIHRKGSRLREEVDQHLEREKNRTTNLAINHPLHHHPADHPPHPHPQPQPHHHHHHHPHLQQQQQQQQQQHAAAVPTSSAAPVHLQQQRAVVTTTARVGTGGDSHSGSSSSSTSSGNNITIHHSNPATTTTTTSNVASSGSAVSATLASPNTTTTTVIVSSAGAPTVAAGGGGTLLAKSFQNQLLGAGRRELPQSASVAGSGGGTTATTTTTTAATPVVDHNVQILRNERDRLLDKLSAYEAETFAGRMREAKMHDELETLTLTMRDLQEQLKVAHSQKLELNSKLHDLHLQTVNRSAPSSPESIKVRQQQHQGSAPPQTSSSSSSAAGAGQHAPKPATRYHQPHYQHGAATSGKSSTAATASPHEDPLLVEGASVAAPGAGGGLGRLDVLLGSPRLPKVRSLDSKKIAAILLETNIVELQRHLLTVTVQNQVLQQRLEQATRSRLFLSEKFEKSKEDLDDLRFQLMEKSIELEGTKAQLRVIESKSTGGGKSAPPSAETSPEHTGRASATVVQQQQQQQHQHHSGHLLQHHPLHHHHHHHHHQQQQQQQQHHLHQPHPGVPSVAVNSQLAMRLPSSQVSTPSMKAMTPVAMDDMIAQHQQHSSSTESAQDQAERDSIGARLQQQPSHHQAPETPRRRPSKIPLPGTKGSSAPKPPSGRNFSATPTPTTPTGPTAMQRTLGGGGGGGSSGPSSNRSLTKSTGSLYVKSSDATSFGAQHQHLVTTATTTTTGSSWRNSSSSSSNSTSKDTPSLEKSRSSSIPISATPKGSQQQAPLPGERGTPMGTRGTPTMMTLPPPPIPPSVGCYGGGVVSSSPLPRPKRDTLTTKVKNCDSLSRKQSMRKDTPSASIGSGQSATFAGGSPAAAPAPAVRERKPSAGGGALRHASSSSLGSGGHAGDTASGIATSQQPASGNANSSTNGTTTTTSDNGKARRSSTFRLAKPTLMPLLLATGPPGPGLVQTLPLPGIGPAHEATTGAAAADASPQRAGVILRVGGAAAAAAAAGRTRSQTATGGTVPSVSVVRAAFSTPSVSGEQEEEEEEAGRRPLLFPGDRIARNLIGEYLAAKRTRSAAQHQEQQQQQPQMMPIPPPIFHVLQSPSAGHLVNRQRCERQNDELAYRHPRLLMTDDEADEVSLGASDPFSTGYRVSESEGDCSIELVLQDDAGGTNGPDDREEETSAANESLIVPRPKMIAFHSLKGAKERQQQQQPTSSTCRLVGKVNPNILKTWEQLSGGGGLQHNSCVHQQPHRRSASAGRILLLAEECSVGGTTIEGPAAAPSHRLRAATSPSSSGYLHFDTGDGGDGEQADEASDDGESADERQSYLLYCPQQQPYHHHHLGGGNGDEGEREAEEEVIEFKVNKLKHHPAAVASAADTRTTSSSGTSAGVTTTTVGSTTSEGADFYDSIDAVSTCVREPSVATRPGHGAFLPAGEEDDVDDNYTDLPSVAGGGEGLAEFTSIDRKRLLWSIEIGEQQ